MIGSKRIIISVVFVLAVLTPFAAADRVILTDGRIFEGTATVQDDVVTIEMSYGTISFSRQKVLRIEIRDTPAQQLQKKLDSLKYGDTDAMMEVVRWARQNGLREQADEICRDIIELDEDHAAARRALGHIKIDKQWRTFDQAVELAQNKFYAEQFSQLVNDVLPELLVAAQSEEEELITRRLLARSLLRAGKFSRAAEEYNNLAENTDKFEATRYGVIAEILGQNDDGMYVLREFYPPATGLLGREQPGQRTLEPGPASLSDPLVLKAALRDRAKKMIQSGRESMEEAAKIESSNETGARALYAKAEKAFDRADALVDGISRSYRIEIARRRIASLRKIVETNAGKFDEAKEKLGRKNMTPSGYTDAILGMNHYLNNVREHLEKIIELAKPYPEELVLEIKWAQADLEKIDEMQEVLVAELDDSN